MTSDGSADMRATIPVPIQFRLPDGWQPVDPVKAGAPGAAFVAVHPASRNGRVANITLAEEHRSSGGTLSDIADQALGRLVRVGHGVSLVRRRTYGSDEVPAIAQLATLSVARDGATQQLVQYQVFLALVDERNPDRRVIVETALTATPEQFDQVIDGFGEFVATIRLDQRRAA